MSVALSAQAAAEVSASMPPLPAQIGKYRILGRLGDGATSEVFLGYDDFQRRNVAIKRVRGASSAGDPVDALAHRRVLHSSSQFMLPDAPD